MSRASRPGTADSRCPACRAPLIRQADVLDITADVTPIEPGTDHQIRRPNRLTWCRPQTNPWSTPRLRWIYRSHNPHCPHPHHADHQCPGPTAAATLF